MSLLANIAVPLFFPQPLLALAALIPVIVVETVLLRQRAGLSWRDVSLANAFSTLLGIPLAFVSLMVSGRVFEFMLSRDHTKLYDVIGVLCAVLIPCFVLSVLLEGYYLRSRAMGTSGRSFWLAITRAHCYSYLTLLAFYCSWIAFKISR
ncbi:MAG: hypothetical protein AB7I98_23120 [Verrucomicrobiales bacterium]|nr:hypothetical protein [Verrucomicrobiae bacterium]